jgi:hypothetical protein
MFCLSRNVRYLRQQFCAGQEPHGLRCTGNLYATSDVEIRVFFLDFSGGLNRFE